MGVGNKFTIPISNAGNTPLDVTILAKYLGQYKLRQIRPTKEEWPATMADHSYCNVTYIAKLHACVLRDLIEHFGPVFPNPGCVGLFMKGVSGNQRQR